MRDNGDKCYKIYRTGDDFETEVSFKEIYINFLMEVVNEIKIAINRDLFDSLQIQVKADSAKVSQNNSGNNSDEMDEGLFKTVTTSYETVNFDCIEHYLQYALQSKSKSQKR
jgi:hypothetical protein